MAKKQYTLIVDDEKDALEAEVTQALDALGRGERQRRMKEFMLIGSRLLRENDLRYALLSVLVEKSDEDIYKMIENTATVGGGKRSEPKVQDEPKPEKEVEPEQKEGGSQRTNYLS